MIKFLIENLKINAKMLTIFRNNFIIKDLAII